MASGTSRTPHSWAQRPPFLLYSLLDHPRQPSIARRSGHRYVYLFIFIFLLIQHLSRSSQLKMTYKTIEAYTRVSGAHWDNVNGANIQGTAATAVFNSYVTQKVRSYLIKYYLTNIM
jgi:hypothetical protein